MAERFRDVIQHAPFPCAGAKPAPSHGQMRMMVANDITSGWDDTRIFPALLAFICRYRARPNLFQSFVVLFEGACSLFAEAFETALWVRVQSFPDKDRCLGQGYDPRFALDPEDPHFSLSPGGDAFFVVGLHPAARRRARRFETPALVFSLLDQFARLRASIVDRAVAWAGSLDPMLAQHGEQSAARPFSGRGARRLDVRVPARFRGRPLGRAAGVEGSRLWRLRGTADGLLRIGR
ncbi:YqcI/YcgG family protein [Methylobacterium phyllostachyos]|uniref:YqcI/YcgG family protein n=1 Tax=Methylobacterium phyllostachyos TaxID=582672 RepID=UPI003CC7A761